MIVKFFANRGSGSPKASIDYLRGKNQDRELATVLRGDPDLTQRIAEASEFKNRYTVGCLSFEERDLPLKSKREIMEKFESTMFSGLEKDQYSITWIEHRDKDRLELNFFIANTELTTGKRLQPYYDRVDRGLTDSFSKVINQEYGLSDPYAPEKKQLIKIDKAMSQDTKELKQALTDFYIEKIQSGKITDRQKIIENLTQSGIEITRTTERSISIKNPHGVRNVRLDGEVFSNEFYRDLENRKQGLPTKQDEYLKTRQESYEKAVILLEKLTRNRKINNLKKYPVKDDLKKVENDSEQARSFKDIRAELEQRTSERERVSRANHQRSDSGVEAEYIGADARHTDHDRESLKNKAMDGRVFGSDRARDYSRNGSNDLLLMEQSEEIQDPESRDRGFKDRERELSGDSGIRGSQLDRDRQGREWGSVYREQEPKSRGVRIETGVSSPKNSKIRDFYHELSGRVKGFIQRIKAGRRSAEDSVTASNRELSEQQDGSREKEQQIDEYRQRTGTVNREIEQRKSGITENQQFIKELDRSLAESEREIERVSHSEKVVDSYINRR